MSLSVAVVFWAAVPARGQITAPTVIDFFEGFETTERKGVVSGVTGWGAGALTLIRDSAFVSRGFIYDGGLQITIPGATPHQLQGIDVDFDGFDDHVIFMDEPSCQLNYGINRGVDEATNRFLGWDWGGTDADAHKIGTPSDCDPDAIVKVGRFGHNEGDETIRKGILYLGIKDIKTEGSIETCLIYQPIASTGDPSFATHEECDGIFPVHNQVNGVSVHWRDGAVQVMDWNNDGYDDLLIGSGFGSVNRVHLYLCDGNWGFTFYGVILGSAGLATPIASIGNPFTNDASCNQDVSKGFSVLLVDDFTGNGQYDIIAASVSEPDVQYWRGSADGQYLASGHTSWRLHGGPNYAVQNDFDQDGDIDFVIGSDKGNITDGDKNGTSNSSCSGTNDAGRLYYFQNQGDGTFAMELLAGLMTQGAKDLDWLSVQDIDGDGKPDVIGGNEQACKYTGTRLTCPEIYLNLSSANGFGGGSGSDADGYNPEGYAESRVIDAVDRTQAAIVSVTVTDLTAITDNGTSITLRVSNNGGGTWEQLSQDEIDNKTPHDFRHFGSDLKFMAELRRPADNAAVTPTLDYLALQYVAVPRRLYSRSRLAIGTVWDDERTPPVKHEILVAASFYYPGHESHLMAYDITALAAGTAGSLERVDSHASVDVLWDAGAMLQTTSGANRSLYTAHAAGTDGRVNDRLPFTEMQYLGSATLSTLMAVEPAEGLEVLRFVRDGMGSVMDSGADRWKFFDVGHSSPVFVAGPTGDADYFDDGYDGFKASYARSADGSNPGRIEMVYIGANDGFLHAFDGLSGSERWAFVPHNLLAKLKTQLTSPYGDFRYAHNFFVDGAVQVADVFDTGADAWKTVLVAGQALGQGADENNYYFALDVTNPTDPRPLWEFTDPVDLVGGLPPQICSPATEEVPYPCGEGTDLSCCQYVHEDGTAQQEYYCAEVGGCAPPGAVLGETWSPPALGRVRIGGHDRWVVFFGSGYNNRGTLNTGRSIYAIDAIEGVGLGRWDLSDLPRGSSNPSTIDNTIPGGVTLVDADDNGYVDRLYVGDLEGRLWKLDVSDDGSSPGADSQLGWDLCVLFEAGDYDDNGGRDWAPIITRPAVAFVQPFNRTQDADNQKPNVYFGTGGDDRAPDNLTYRFYSVWDDDALGACRSTPKTEQDLNYDRMEWVVGDGLTNDRDKTGLAQTDAEGGAGDRFWADPVVVSDTAIYFASLPGDIESVNPYSSIRGQSKLYGYATRDFYDQDNVFRRRGSSLFFPDPWLAVASKVRQAALLRADSNPYWTRRPLNKRPGASGTEQARDKTDVFIQQLTGSSPTEQPPIMRVSDPGMQPGQKRVRILRWREILLQ